VGAVAYPFGKRSIAKRLGIYPQYILGTTVAFPAVTGWASIFGHEQSLRDNLVQCWPLCLFTFAWIVYLNTAYSYQDIKDDAKLHVNSLYVFAGQKIHAWLLILAFITLVSLAMTLRPIASSWLWLTWMGVWLFSFYEQLAKFDAQKPESGGLIHRRNFALGIWNIMILSIELVKP
jgi:4-hydroxybenzoate polyprenyltransferase